MKTLIFILLMSSNLIYQNGMECVTAKRCEIKSVETAVVINFECGNTLEDMWYHAYDEDGKLRRGCMSHIKEPRVVCEYITECVSNTKQILKLRAIAEPEDVVKIPVDDDRIIIKNKERE